MRENVEFEGVKELAFAINFDALGICWYWYVLF